MNGDLHALKPSPDAEELRASGLFDEAWYLARYPDVRLLGMDPVEHYVWLGARLGRSPSPRFDTQAYLAANPEVLELGINPLLHFLRNGQADGRSGAPLKADVGSENVHGQEHLASNAPHYGRAFQRIVEAANARTKPRGVSEEYDTIRNEFDVAYYLMRYPDIARAVKIDPVQHYISYGASEGRDPSPHFSTKHYVARYPEVAKSGLNPFYHWLKIGRGSGYIAESFSEFDGMCEIIGRNPREVQRLLTEKREDLRARLERGVLGEMVAKAVEMEPLIAHSWRQAFQVKLPPFHSDEVVNQVVARHCVHKQANFRRAKAVVVIPHCRMSGATRVAGYLANALAQIYGKDELVVVRTDSDIMQFPEWFPEGCRHISLATAVKLPRSAQERLLIEFLRSLRPTAAFNVNSRLFWNALQSYGKALSASTSLYAYLFCSDKSLYGYWDGYPLRKFYRYFDIFSAVFTDSHALADALRRRYLVPPTQLSKIVTLETPVSALPSVAQAPISALGRRPQIFWASRFDRQKRVDLVIELARGMPNIDFRLWGEPVLDVDRKLENLPSNTTLEGVYEDLSQVPVEQCDLWLYTSEWDGVPNILIDIATRGIPIVGTLVGGTGEILRKGMSWPVSNIEDIGAYEAAILEVLCDPTEARRRALRLREYLVGHRTAENYLKTLKGALPRQDAA